jgi:hypothetical protein
LQKDIIYFCREYNDLDHAVPIADELLKSPYVNSVCFYNYNIEISYEDDYRINYLTQHKNFIYREMNNDLSITENIFFKLCTVFQKTFIINKFNRIIIGVMSKFINRIYKNYDFSTLINSKNNYIILFDHSKSSFINNAYNYSSQNDIPVGLLMHGLDPTENLLMGINMLTGSEFINSYQHFNHADVFFVNNKQYKRRCIVHGVNKDIIHEIGSARFSYYWSGILDKITPYVSLPLIDPKFIKIVLMLNKYKYNTWKEEIERVIKSLLLIDNVFVIVKPHTRKMVFDSIKNKNLFIADIDFHSRKLIEWSDLTLFTNSSIFLDALLLDKPVLFLRLATSNKLACNHIMEDWNVDCRDDLIMWVNRFKKDRKTRTYTEQERVECLNYYVNDHDNQLLTRYAESILAIKK